MKTKSSLLKKMIQSKELEFIMEAHNGISAKLVEECGFKAIWGSGLCISASLGVRDCNEASWTQILDLVEFMSDATSIPILLDGDTGYGNFNNTRRLVKKLEQRNVAGVCIEDKTFPKMNSFARDFKQPLATIEEFVGKIKACRDSQSDDNFVLVARTEAFVLGWGLKEALKRATAYAEAGADAILVHSKRNDAADIESFMKEWSDRLPIVIVPTTYSSTNTDLFKKLGVSSIIWANHSFRASINTMRKTMLSIRKNGSVKSLENKIASIEDIFSLQNMRELKIAESAYLPK